MIDTVRLQRALRDLNADDDTVIEAAIDYLRALLHNPQLDDAQRRVILQALEDAGVSTDVDTDAWVDALAMAEATQQEDNINEAEAWLDSLAESRNTQLTKTVETTEVLPENFLEDLITDDSREVSEVPSWLAGLQNEDEAQELPTEEYWQVEADDTPPDWLQSMVENPDADPSQTQQVVPSGWQPDQREKTDTWDGLFQFTGEDDIPDWLQEVEDDVETSMPAWLADTLTEGDVPAIKIEPTPSDDILQPLMDEEPANIDVSTMPAVVELAEEASTIPEEDFPDWLRETAPEEPDVAVEPQPIIESVPAPVQVAPAPMPPPPPIVTAPQSTSEVQFSAYHPRTIRPLTWEPFYAYVFHNTAAADVIADAMEHLGAKAGTYSASTARAQTAIPEGTAVTATPYMPGFQFNPMSITLGFYDAWNRFDFQIRAKNAALNQFETGRITFTVDGIVVADVPISAYVGSAPRHPEIEAHRNDLYSRIFCSYSHDDAQIVERMEEAYTALGLDYLRDVTTLKSGSHWSEELYGLIDSADVFQLFWSQAAAQSPYVQQEWLYALRRTFQNPYFIRPVFWQNPAPPIPSQLGHIHFRYQPDLATIAE